MRPALARLWAVSFKTCPSREDLNRDEPTPVSIGARTESSDTGVVRPCDLTTKSPACRTTRMDRPTRSTHVIQKPGITGRSRCPPKPAAAVVMDTGVVEVPVGTKVAARVGDNGASVGAPRVAPIVVGRRAHAGRGRCASRGRTDGSDQTRSQNQRDEQSEHHNPPHRRCLGAEPIKYIRRRKVWSSVHRAPSSAL